MRAGKLLTEFHNYYGILINLFRGEVIRGRTELDKRTR